MVMDTRLNKMEMQTKITFLFIMLDMILAILAPIVWQPILNPTSLVLIGVLTIALILGAK